MSKIIKLFGHTVESVPPDRWRDIVNSQLCPYTGNRCFKVRKSEPEISIGTCTVSHGSNRRQIIICPNRLLQRRQVFTDCVHLLSKLAEIIENLESRISGGTLLTLA